MPVTNPTQRRRTATRAKADGFDRQDHGERTRERIIAAAVGLFSRKGFRGTGLAALAKEVEMSGPGLLYYFGSMERLLLEVMAEHEHADRVDQPQRQKRVRMKDLRSAGRHTTDTKTLAKLYAVLGAESIEPEAPLHDYFVGRYRAAHQLARRVFEIEARAGRVPSTIDAGQLAYEVQAMTLGMTLLWLTDPETFDIRTAIEKYFDRLERELAAPAE
jgi:AcrR family transcriptional regulator